MVRGEFETIEQAGRVARVRVRAAANQSTLVAVRLGQRWLPLDWAREWQLEIARFREQLRDLEPERFLRAVFRVDLDTARRQVEQLARAQSVHELRAALR